MILYYERYEFFECLVSFEIQLITLSELLLRIMILKIKSWWVNLSSLNQSHFKINIICFYHLFCQRKIEPSLISHQIIESLLCWELERNNDWNENQSTTKIKPNGMIFSQNKSIFFKKKIYVKIFKIISKLIVKLQN